MILHSDGRIEGTPDELAAYRKLTAPKTEPLTPTGPFWPNPYRDVTPPRWIPGWVPPTGPGLPDQGWIITCQSGGVTYTPDPKTVAYN